jgi:hypothetical protein
MADFNPMNALGQIGSLVKKLPGFQRASQTPIGRYAAESAGNAVVPGLGTAVSFGARNPGMVKGLPVRGLASGAATVGSAGLGLLGMATSELGVGIPLIGASVALGAAAPAIGNEAQYRWNQLMGQGGSPGPNGIQTGKYGTTDWNPSANPTAKRGNQGAIDRNYEAEKNRIAQQTAQNPLFQKYQVADLTKQYNTASSPAEKQRIGLEIWAQSNPLLAAKLKSGQVGYAESRTAPGMSNAGGSPIGGLPMPTTQFDAAAAMAPGMTMEQTFGTALPGVGMVSSTPQVFNPGVPQGPLTDGMIEASYGQRLFSSPDFVKIAKDKAFLQQAYRQQGL